MCSLKKWMPVTTVLLATVVSAVCLLPSQAAPPAGNGAVPPGKIFFLRSSAIGGSTVGAVYGLWNMNADGSGKQALPYQPNLEDYAQLSHLAHQGHRWFLEFRLSPNFAHKVAVFAVRDDGDPDHIVLLIDEPGVSMGHCRWGQDDSRISIASIAEITSPEGFMSWDPTALAHIHAAWVAFDPDTGLPALTTPLIEVAEGEQPGYLDIMSHDWSPFGDELVYQRSGNPGPTSSMIADLLTGTTRLLTDGAYSPVWSPDGSRIAYTSLGNIYVVNPDGTGLLKVTTNNSTRDIPRGWSPDSKYILFERNIIKYFKSVYQEYSDVLRVPAVGGKAVNLTTDIDGYDQAMCWR